MTRFKDGDRIAVDRKTYKVTRVSPGGGVLVAVHGRGDSKTQHTFKADEVNKAKVA